jgi:hypothetical protein
VSDNFVAPKVMVEKTKNELAHLKANPRPDSSVRGKVGSRGSAAKLPDDDDDYSDDNYEEDFD